MYFSSNVGVYRRLFKLPKFTPDGFRVTMSFLATGDPDKYNLSNTYRRLLSYKEINLNTDMFCSGDIIIFDAKLCTMSHALKMTPTVIRDFMYCIQVKSYNNTCMHLSCEEPVAECSKAWTLILI